MLHASVVMQKFACLQEEYFCTNLVIARIPLLSLAISRPSKTRVLHKTGDYVDSNENEAMGIMCLILLLIDEDRILAVSNK